jgi:hypothetical protein
MRIGKRVLVRIFVGAIALVATKAAFAGQLIDKNAVHPSLAVNRDGIALITYTKAGRLRHTLAWGAVNARLRPKRPGLPQVRFRIDYSGGSGAFHDPLWTHFRDVCGRYDGPRLPWLVAACRAPDGSYWALQRWQVSLPNFGLAPWLSRQRAWWLRLAHWRGPLPKLEAHVDWVYDGQFQEVFGRYTYRGVGIRGFGNARAGIPTDDYGRLLYLDTRNSKYGSGWYREKGLLSEGPPGMFCYGFFPNDRGLGTGDRYRITAAGPGVMPDVFWSAPGLHRYDPKNPADVELEQRMNAKLDQLRGSWNRCTQH